MKQVCIIGAGSSGITAIKALKDQNISFDCYEKGSQIGGVWRFNNDNGVSSAYRSLHINTNRKVMAYQDFPMPDHYPMFPHHSNIITYFENYVEKFDLQKHIIFNTSVEKVVQNADETFTLTLNTGATENYEYIIVANGHHWHPRFPEPAFEGEFTGEVIHSHHYKEVDQVKNKNVLIVGIGNSAVDIACEAARQHTGRVVISTRSGAYIIPNWLGSMPFDDLANPITTSLPLWLQRIFFNAALWLARGKQEKFGVPKPSRPTLKEHPTLSQDLLPLAGRGAVKFKPNIKKFHGKTVIFEDGSEEDFDIIIYATGYKVSFPFLKHLETFDIENTNAIHLFKKVIHPSFQKIFFLALIQPLGAIMPLAEIQAKWVAGLIKGKYKLPPANVMQENIDKETAKIVARFGKSPRHTLQVDFFNYKRTIKNAMRNKF
jgi:dimethylaniline monooxygenase (N-oxide forming)